MAHTGNEEPSVACCIFVCELSWNSGFKQKRKKVQHFLILDHVWPDKSVNVNMEISFITEQVNPRTMAPLR